MTTPPDADEFPEKLRRLEALVLQAERQSDPTARAHARDVVRALLDLHAVGLERLLEHVSAAGAVGTGIIDACAADDVVGGLLLLHGLHPLDLEDRVGQALEQVRPHLEAHGGGVELIAVADGIVRLRLDGECDCPSSAAAVRQTVEDALCARAPDAAGVEFEGDPAATGTVRVALPLV